MREAAGRRGPPSSGTSTTSRTDPRPGFSLTIVPRGEGRGRCRVRLAFTPARPVRSMRWTGPIRRRTGRERRARCAPRNARGQGSQTTLSCGKNIMRKTTFRETVIYELVAAYLLVGRKCNLTIYRILMRSSQVFMQVSKSVFVNPEANEPRPQTQTGAPRLQRTTRLVSTGTHPPATPGTCATSGSTPGSRFTSD